MEENKGVTSQTDELPASTESILNKVGLEAPKEVSAATLGRMMGLATISDLKLLDSKIDLLSTKISGLVLKLDKALTMLAGVSTGSDLERIDVQIGGLKGIIKDAVQNLHDDLKKR